MLAKHPKKQCKLRSEILAIAPTKDCVLTVESMKKLVYLKASIKESLRMFPVSPGVEEEIRENIVLEGFQIPEGTRIFLASSFLQKEERYFSRANEFIPERWLDNEGLILQKNLPYTLVTFGLGSKKSAFKRVINLGLEVTIAILIRNFHIKISSSIDNAFQSRVINTPGIPLKFKFIDVKY